jgi:hypothetical protein
VARIRLLDASYGVNAKFRVPPKDCVMTTNADHPVTNPLAGLSLANTLSLGPSSTTPKRPAIPSDPGLPGDLLPPEVESWLRDTSILAGVPPVMTTVPFLASTGGVIGHRLGLQIHPGWKEFPALWVALVALTGTGKTPALQAVSQPFYRLHDEIRAASEPATRSPLPSLVVGNPNWPHLERALGVNNGLILHCDELVGLLNVIRRRSTDARQHYLSLWATDHIFRPQQSTIHHPVVSIIGGIQPLMVNRIRHRESDGLMERFLLVVASAKDDAWRTDLPAQPPIDPVLDRLRILRNRAGIDTVSFTPEAGHLWRSWYDAHTTLYAPDPTRLIPFGFYRKYPTHLARMALVLHALWHADDPTASLQRETLDRAITLIEYLRIQHHRSMAFINQRHAVMNPGDALTGRILEILARTPQPHVWVTRTRLAAQLNDRPSALVSSALDVLLRADLIESRTIKTAGRPAVEYRLLAPANPD